MLAPELPSRTALMLARPITSINWSAVAFTLSINSGMGSNNL